MAKGESVRKAMAMRIAPNSLELNTTSPFLIRIKDVPQMRASIISRNQASGGVPVFSGAGEVIVLISKKLKR